MPSNYRLLFLVSLLSAEGYDYCPWLSGDSGVYNILQCINGNRCDISIDPSCCGHSGGRAKCPAETPVMCNRRSSQCGDDYCCSTYYNNCSNLGGPRGCHHHTPEPTPMPTQPPAPQCPWSQGSSGYWNVLKCMDGSYCEMPCSCIKNQGRAQCPYSHPVMCAWTAPICGGGEHCCRTKFDNCRSLGGPRQCNQGSVQPSPSHHGVRRLLGDEWCPNRCQRNLPPTYVITCDPACKKDPARRLGAGRVGAGTKMPECPWKYGSTGYPNTLMCLDGTTCQIPCSCIKHQGRAMCPDSHPVMCAWTAPICGGGEHCCQTASDNCRMMGGPRGCNRRRAQGPECPSPELRSCADICPPNGNCYNPKMVLPREQCGC